MNNAVENPMVRGAAAAYEAQFFTDLMSVSDAQDEVLRDTDTFGHWLGAELAQAPVSKWLPIQRPHVIKFEDMPMHDLVALLLDRAQPDMVLRMTRDAIASRYLLTADAINRVNALIEGAE